MNGPVAIFANDVQLGLKREADQLLEAGFKEIGAEVAFVGLVEAAIALKQPVNGKLQGAATVEAGGTGVRVNKGFGFSSGFVNFGPFSFEKWEMDTHYLPFTPKLYLPGDDHTQTNSTV